MGGVGEPLAHQPKRRDAPSGQRGGHDRPKAPAGGRAGAEATHHRGTEKVLAGLSPWFSL